jgi:hypothetical protein
MFLRITIYNFLTLGVGEMFFWVNYVLLGNYKLHSLINPIFFFKI